MKRLLKHLIRPISLTLILAKVFESIVVNWVDDMLTPQIDESQFGGLAGTGTTAHRDGPHVVRGYRQVRYFRASAPCRRQQSF